MRRLLSAFAVLLLVPAAARAQAADTSFRDFYESLPKRSESELKEIAQSRDAQRAAFAALELHDRTGNQAHSFRAVRLLGSVVKEQNGQPWAHFGLARALNKSPRAINILRSNGVSLEVDGENAAEVEAHTQLQLALQLDPNFSEARALLGQYGDVPGGVLGAEPAYTDANAYSARLVNADDSTLAELVHDVAIIATPQELITLTQGTLEKRIAMLQLFWKKRALRDGVSANERVLEHYRRIHFARKHFGPPVPYYTVYGRKRTGLETQMDDRGLIYVRYGPPHNLEHITDEVTEHEKNRRSPQIWAYRQPDGRFHVYMFRPDGAMESDPLRLFGPARTLNEAISTAQVWETLSRYDRRYHFIAMRAENLRLHQFMARVNAGHEASMDRRRAEANLDASRQLDRIRDRNRQMVFAAFDMDAAIKRFPRPLTLYHDFATFRGNGCTDLVYSVAAPAPSYRLTLAVVDTFTWESQGIDTMVNQAARAGAYVRATGVFCATPDHNGYVRLTASADSVTGVTASAEMTIPDYSQPGLMMSSMLFARVEDGPFVRGRARLSLVPPNQFKEGEPFRLFYEIYNLPAGRTYRTEITLTTTEGNLFSRLFQGKTSMKVTFEGVSESGDVVQEVRMIVPQIEAGEAEVHVRVTDLTTRKTSESKKRIWIIPADPPVKN